MFPQIKKVIFNDVSFFKCNNTTNVLLSIYYLLLYKETWYESKFNAKLTDKDKRNDLNIFKELLLNKPKSGIFSFYKDIIKTNNWHEYFINYKNIYKCRFIKKRLCV